MKLTQVVVVAGAVIASVAGSGFAAQAPGRRAAAGERFEVTSIKAVRPTLVNTIDALKKGDVAKAQDAFEAIRPGTASRCTSIRATRTCTTSSRRTTRRSSRKG